MMRKSTSRDWRHEWKLTNIQLAMEESAQPPSSRLPDGFRGGVPSADAICFNVAVEDQHSFSAYEEQGKKRSEQLLTQESAGRKRADKQNSHGTDCIPGN